MMVKQFINLGYQARMIFKEKEISRNNLNSKFVLTDYYSW